MISRFILICALLFTSLSCINSSKSDDDESKTTQLAIEQREFLDNLSTLCGKSFRGEQTYSAPGRESWADRNFIMHVTVCEEDKVYIPFHLDDDHSRTWMLMVENGRLRFRHDHSYDDGTPHELTLYGGYSDPEGTAFIQNFPADDYSIELLDDGLDRVWRFVLAEDFSTLSYELEYFGELVFSAMFNLSEPI